MMQKTRDNIYVLFIVIIIHIGCLVVIIGLPSPPAQAVTMPTLQGRLLHRQPEKPIPTTDVTAPPLSSRSPSVAPAPKVVKKQVQKTARAHEPVIEKKPVLHHEFNNTLQQETAPDVVPVHAPVSTSSTQEQASASEVVSPPQLDANPLNNPAPVYPSLSRKLREQGTVLLEIFILADGSVGDIRVKQSSGFSRLDKTAIQAIKRWRYLPARQNNQPIDYWYLQPLEFTLK